MRRRGLLNPDGSPVPVEPELTELQQSIKEKEEQVARLQQSLQPSSSALPSIGRGARRQQDYATQIADLQAQIAADKEKDKFETATKGMSPAEVWYYQNKKERPTLTQEQINQGYSLQDAGGRRLSRGFGSTSNYVGEKIAPPRPNTPLPGDQSWGYDYNSNSWVAQKTGGGGLFGGSALGGLLSAPFQSIGSIATDIAHGENVGTTLRNDLAISQGAITGAIDSWGGRAGDELADYGQRLTDITGRNLEGIGNAAESQSQGDISAGFREADDSNRGAWRTPEIAIPASLVAAYLTGGAASGAFTAAGGGLAGTAAAAGVGAASGAAQAAAMGERNLGRPAVAGGVSGAMAGAGNWAQGMTGTGYGDAALRAGGNQALGTAARGGNSNEILQSGLMGAASGGLGYGANQFGQQYGLDRGLTSGLSGAATGALRGGSEGAQAGLISGLASGYGGQYGGQAGAAAGSSLARLYNQQQAQRNAQPRAPSNLSMLTQRPMQRSPTLGANTAPSGYNQSQMQQMYAQYLAQQRRG